MTLETSKLLPNLGNSFNESSASKANNSAALKIKKFTKVNKL